MLFFMAAMACTDTYVSETPLTTPQALLTFLNDPQTTFELLDNQVGLDSRAARQLVAHRDGPDWQPLTADDNPIDSLEELESIERIGPSSVWKIEHYIDNPTQGWVVEGVPFSEHQAELTVEWSNSATPEQLQELDLWSDTVASLLSDRPFSHVLDLAETYGVGPATLATLRDSATPTSPQGD